MKSTAKNIIDQWVDIKPLLPPELAKIGEESFLPFANLYDDFDEEMAQDFDLFLEKVNKYTNKSNRKYVRGSGRYVRKKKDDPKAKQKDKPKKETKKTEKKQRAAKAKVGESPAWLKTVESFVKSIAGRTKDTWRVRNFVLDIQARFSEKHGKNTPNIELIREIQDKLIKYANSSERKVNIPEYADLVAKCKTAIKGKGFTVSNKAKKTEIKPEKLSGFSIGFRKK